MEEKENVVHAENSGSNTNRIMGVAAIFISVLSMIAVVYQSYLAREENQLMRIQQSATVLPYLDYWYSNIDNQYKFVIENKGIGPAFIKDVKFIGILFESKDSLSFNNSHQLYEFMKQHSSYLDSIPVTKSSLNSNMLLSPSERKEFFTFSFDKHEQKEKFRDEFYKYFGGFEIVYEDVYGARWILDSDRGFPLEVVKE